MAVFGKGGARRDYGAERARLWNESCEIYATLIDGGSLPIEPTTLFVRDDEVVFLHDYDIGWRTVVSFTPDEIIMALGAERYYQRSAYAVQEIRSVLHDEHWGVTSYLTDQRLIIMSSRKNVSLWHSDLIAIHGNLDDAGALLPDEFNLAYDGHRPYTLLGPTSLRLAISLAWAAGGANALDNQVFAPVAAAVSTPRP
ncbi:hypothetical protein [Actinomadura rayongensis]|uniref:Uncharacterized protein n=1 Tax=Actinomadura rayongensis TaxID=1429076 RepID=A0A6I4WBN4_9ACTN|nr:hypothetical protein [Actinomadura rayongensis]MXQ64454.1 hypothetical protein [Actinomadura rayongensis]